MKQLISIIAILGGLLFVFKPDILEGLIPDNSTPSITISPQIPVIPQPVDASLLALAKSFTNVLVSSNCSRTDALELVYFYQDFAAVALPNPDLLKTTVQVVNAHLRSGRVLFNSTGMKGKYPQAAIAGERVLNQAMFNSPDPPAGGIPVISITPEVARKLIEAFQALSWASLEAYKASIPNPAT